MLPMITVAGKNRFAGQRRHSATATRSNCIKTQGGCPSGYRLMGYDTDGQAICCVGSVAGPVVRNPPSAPSAYDECVANLCWDAANPGKCISTYCAWLKPAELPGQGRATRGRAVAPVNPRHELCRSVCQHHGVGIKFHQCYQECMSPLRSSPGTVRVIARMAAAARRRSMSVGHAGRTANACCGSCANGGACEGGCGVNCTCGKEGPLANVSTRQTAPMRLRKPGCWVKGKYVVPCPTTSAIGYRPTPRKPGCWVKGKYVVPCPTTSAIGYRPSPLAPKCSEGNPCPVGYLCVNGRCVASVGYGPTRRTRLQMRRAY